VPKGPNAQKTIAWKLDWAYWCN